MVRPSNTEQGYTTLGKVGAVHGVKGWVRLISFTEPADNILRYRNFYISTGTPPESREKIEIDESRVQGKHFIGHIAGCDDREEARAYTGRELQVKQSDLPELETEEFYWFQLEGLQVINLQNEVLGQVDHLIETGANDVMIVRPVENSIDKEERLIPFIKEQVIKQVDLDENIIRVDWEKDF